MGTQAGHGSSVMAREAGVWSHELQIERGLLGGTGRGIHQGTDHRLLKTFTTIWGAATWGGCGVHKGTRGCGLGGTAMGPGKGSADA